MRLSSFEIVAKVQNCHANVGRVMAFGAATMASPRGRAKAWANLQDKLR